MNQKSPSQSKKPRTNAPQNTLEALRELGGGVAKKTASEMKNLGGGVVDQLIGYYEDEHATNEFEYQPEKSKSTQKQKREVKLFDYTEYRERILVSQEIKTLMDQIKQEIELIKRSDKSLLQDIKDIHNIAVSELTEKPGIYHVRFFEVVLSILKTLRERIGESKTWLQALMTKKKKRGSLFVVRSKKMGTQYSLSQELQVSRNVQ